MLGTLCQLWPVKSCSGKRMFWYSMKNPLKYLWRSSLLVKLQARSLLLCKNWAQSQLFLKNFAWDFQNTFFIEYIWVVASWNYIVSTVKEVLQEFWYTFGPASIRLDPKSVVKINYNVPITSGTKLKKHKVRNELIWTYF